MSIPGFNEEGDLPPAVYRATLTDVMKHFASGSLQRSLIAGRLRRIYQLALSTEKLSRFVIFGSFVTAKEEPDDVDIILLMDDTFDLNLLTGEATLLFRHMEADAHFGASIFWSTRSGAIGGEEAMLEYWQNRREGGKRGIIEIVAEEP